jgi:hypothetical protein
MPPKKSIGSQNMIRSISAAWRAILPPPIFDPFAFDRISYSALLAGLGNLCRLSGLGGRILDATPGGFDFGFAGAVIAGP